MSIDLTSEVATLNPCSDWHLLVSHCFILRSHDSDSRTGTWRHCLLPGVSNLFRPSGLYRAIYLKLHAAVVQLLHVAAYAKYIQYHTQLVHVSTITKFLLKLNEKLSCLHPVHLFNLYVSSAPLFSVCLLEPHRSKTNVCRATYITIYASNCSLTLAGIVKILLLSCVIIENS